MAHKFVNGVVIDLTNEELAVLQNKEASWQEAEASRFALIVRNKRDRLLAETDWMALSDITMGSETTTYRQALRDITKQAGFPYTVVWPTKS